ncbi:hypothetical protein PLANPX_0455 [Lacipirellula parvula]|uniref:Uncharacterized protein n=1 Tax=Lacipirellula parvula TaxID=2650471 RepID=A0A5K7X8T7_9BACT|nr:hypothetical protein PLANPX_0455 [Lacipirellula parvula]
MYRIVLVCRGVPAEIGLEAAADITAEFREYRTWYENVTCVWAYGLLVLQAESDCDEQGLALSDEFSDCISACTPTTFDFEIEVESVAPLT